LFFGVSIARLFAQNTRKVTAMKNTCLLLALLCAQLTVFAQANITGKVTDEAQQPLSFATLALYARADSQLLKGTFSDVSGTFSFTQVPPSSRSSWAAGT
jgi:hypothetical protein